MTGRLTALLVAALAVLGLSATPADAAWNTTGAGTGTQAAMTMPTGNAPVVGMTSSSVLGLGITRTYTLSWPTTELHAGLPVTAYRITRTSTLGGALLSGGTCAGVTLLGLSVPTFLPADVAATRQSCTDTSLADLGTVRYAVTPVYGNWVGTASSWSAPVG